MTGPVTRWRAPAKLTVSLQVLGTRPDGYHELRAEMLAVDLCDELVVDAGGDGLVIEPPAPALDTGPGNLVNRALLAVGRRAHVVVRKRIPVGGGLGGGSADAAAILRWAGVDDVAVAAGLGADVPFCLSGGRALVLGVGERVQPLPFEDRSFVLLFPPMAVDTAAVYRAYDRGAAARGSGNDLEGAALVVEPRLIAWRDALERRVPVPPRLAGSGSTWFVEGSRGSLGLEGLEHLTVEGQRAPLVEVHAVPPGWERSPG